MSDRDGRYDSGGFDETDWLLSQLGSGRRPDLEGREAPQPPVAPQPPAERPRRRAEESLDWFSVAEPTPAEEAPTRALPVVDQQDWSRTGWERPAWTPPAHEPDRRRAAPERLSSVEPPANGPQVPPAFGGPAEPTPPPGPVTPPGSMALTWGDQQSMDTEEGLRAAFRQLSDPSAPAGSSPADGRGAPPSRPDAYAAPPVARSSFAPAAAQSAQTVDFADELWSALNEDVESAAADRDGPGYGEAAYDDGYGSRGEGGYDAYDARGEGRDGSADDGAHGHDAQGDGYHDPQGDGYHDGTHGGGYDAAGGYGDGDGAGEGGYDAYGGRNGEGASYDGGAGYEDGDDDGYQDGVGYGDPAADPRRLFEGGTFEDAAPGYADDRGGFGPDAYADTGRFDDDAFRGSGTEADAWDQYDPRELWEGAAADAHGADAWGREADDWRDSAGRPEPEPETADDVIWYGDEVAGHADERPRRDEVADRGPSWRDEESSRAREFEQAGYLWNLTPDPTAGDPRVPDADEDAAPGPRRGGAAPGDRDPQPGERMPTRRQDAEPFGFGGAPADEYDAGGYDRRGVADAPPAGRGPGGDDGLADLFGGAGFGATGPMTVVPDDDGRGGRGRTGDLDDPYGSRDPFAGYGRDEAPRGADRGGRSIRPQMADDDEGGDRPTMKILAWVAGALAAIVVVALVVALSSRFLGTAEAPVAEEPAPAEPVAAPTEPQAAGVHAWDTLYGSECLQPFESAWAEEFTVVDCGQPHAAQLVHRGALSADEAAEFPGEEALAAQAAEVCSADGVIDPAAVGDVTDLQLSTAYPVTAEQWDAGVRDVYCFVDRASGEPLAVSVAGAGPAAS
ncbi:septum formation family protein [Agromyces sp. SYSU T0242]|uniref:septum formation family protein n=1 Tax=Agromyces litoreus TaxID=3158561 RepID=UPI0033958A23